MWKYLVVVFLVFSVVSAQPVSFEDACEGVSVDLRKVVTGSISSVVGEVVVPQSSCDFFGEDTEFSVESDYYVGGESYSGQDSAVVGLGASGGVDCDLFVGTTFSSQPVVFREEYAEADYVVLNVRVYSPSEGMVCFVNKSIGEGPVVDSHRVVSVEEELFSEYCGRVDFRGEFVRRVSVYVPLEGENITRDEWVVDYSYYLGEGVCGFFGTESLVRLSVEGEYENSSLIGECPFGGGDEFVTDLFSGTLVFRLDSPLFERDCVRRLDFERPRSSDLCNVSYGASPECDGVLPGTELDGMVCDSSCQLTGESLSSDIVFRTCLEDTVSACLDGEPVSDLVFDFGTPLLMSFDIPLTPRLRRNPPLVNVSVDGELRASKQSDSGMMLFRNLSPGLHNITLNISHVDYVDSVVSESVLVEPRVSGKVFAVLDPGRVSLVVGDSLNLNLTVNNSLNFARNFSVSSNLNASVPSSIGLGSGEARTVPVRVGPFGEKGSFVLNLSLSSDGVRFNAISRINVTGVRAYNATIDVLTSEGGARVVVTNTGTVEDFYSLVTCDGKADFGLEPGGSESFRLYFNQPCKVCLYSKRFSKCLTITPLSLVVDIPSFLQVGLNETVDFVFRTESSLNDTMRVRVDSPWISDFNCNATCIKRFSFTPEELGDYVIGFDISLLEAGLEGRARTEVKVVKSFSVRKDEEEISELVGSLEEELSVLRSEGVLLPSAETIVEEARLSEPESPEEVAELLGELRRAEKYIVYAKESEVPGERSPMVNLMIGLSALLGGVGLFFAVRQHYVSNPEHPVYKRLGLSKKREESSGEKRMKESFKGSDLPKLE